MQAMYERGHFHAYVGDGQSLDYRACCVETWMGAITALREMGFRGPGTAVPEEPANEWHAKQRTVDDYPRAVIQREDGDFETCQPGED